MFATQRLAASATGHVGPGHGRRRASTGTRSRTGLARHDGHRSGLVSARDSPGTTSIDRDSGRTGLGARRRALRTTGYRTRPARRAFRTTRDRTRPARVRQGRHGSPVFPRSATHEGRSVRDSPCPARASWIAGFPALRYP